MKRVQDCKTENCIPSPSSCVEWNGGEIEFLNICDGDSLNNVVWELVNKVKEVSDDDISSFDVDSLSEICNKKAPLTVTMSSILDLLKDNQICLKGFIDDLDQRIADLANDNDINVSLKCFAQFDNQGNQLTITRDGLDQLFVDNLCSDKLRISSLESLVTTMQSEIANLESEISISEIQVATCIDAGVKPVSSQVIAIADVLCDLISATGNSDAIGDALGQTPGDLNSEFGLIAGWILTPDTWAENYNNLLLEVENLRQRIITIENTCCAVSCDDVEIAFSVIFNEDKTGIILRFTSGAGTNIPAGFEDGGSSGTITDKDGNVETFILEIENGAEIEVSIIGLNTSGDLVIDITAIMSNGSLTCERCLHKTVKTVGICDFCKICNTGATGTVVILYEDAGEFIGTSFNPSTTTTTTTEEA